jgi:hypothetical protein
VTANAAWQIKEEKTKGSLEVGKLADLVILERNPLEADPASLKDMAVLETIKEGRTIFRRGEAAGGPASSASRPCLHEHDHGPPPPDGGSGSGGGLCPPLGNPGGAHRTPLIDLYFAENPIPRDVHSDRALEIFWSYKLFSRLASRPRWKDL